MSPSRWVLEAPAPRLDRFLADQLDGVPRARIEAWIRAGAVQVNGTPATKPGTRLRSGDVVETDPPAPVAPAGHLAPEDLDLPTLFEDDHLWIIDKPAGLVVHPGPGHAGGTVLNALLHRIGAGTMDVADIETRKSRIENEEDDEAPNTPYPGLVHRLDRFTTGCLCLAKDAAAQASLQAQFKARTVDKRYLALAQDSRKLPELGSLLVDAPIARHRTERLRMVVAAAGRPSQTRIRVLARGRGLALLECELLTGRTHQIRVHLRHLGAPIVGDGVYGGPSRWLDQDREPRDFPHPMLHAWKLTLAHPSDQRILAVTAPPPPEFLAALHGMGLASPA